jgi:CMP-N-acetylneuraminic acid synthetase
LSSIVALIPARGGSKGLPGKNIKSLNGKPLIAYTIAASLDAKSISRTIVSTDDNDTARISRDFGAEVPFMRPTELAEDHIFDFPVIKHALEYLDDVEGSQPEIIVYLRPTMPIRTAYEIDEVVSLLLQKEEADCIRTARPAPYPPHWMKKINSSGYLVPYDEHIIPHAMKRRQELPKVVICDGYVDAARVTSVLRENNFPPGKKLAFYRENVPFIDIDTPEDWEYCEYYLQK